MMGRGNHIIGIRTLIVVPDRVEVRSKGCILLKSRMSSLSPGCLPWQWKSYQRARGQDLPVECQLVTRLDLDRIRCLLVAHHIASHVNGIEILDRRVGIAPRRSCVVWGCPDAAECPLIDAVYEDTLPAKLADNRSGNNRRRQGVLLSCHLTQMKQCACTRATLDAVKHTARRAWKSFMAMGFGRYATRAVVQLGVTRVQEPGWNLEAAGSVTQISSYEYSKRQITLHTLFL